MNDEFMAMCGAKDPAGHQALPWADTHTGRTTVNGHDPEYTRNDLGHRWGQRSSPGRKVAQYDDEVHGAGTDNDAAVAAYRLSVKACNPLSERKLAQMFGRRSRRWAHARITEARQSP